MPTHQQSGSQQTRHASRTQNNYLGDGGPTGHPNAAIMSHHINKQQQNAKTNNNNNTANVKRQSLFQRLTKHNNIVI